MQDPAQSIHAEPLVPRTTYIGVWIGLLLLTGLTLQAAGMHIGRISTVVAVAIATVKASLVLYYFMGLKYERLLFRLMFLVTAATLSIFFILTYVDVLFRR